MTVKLSGSLPKDYESNGLYQISRDLVKQPNRRHLLLMVVDCVRTTIEHGGADESTPTMGVLYVEPILDSEDLDTILEIFSRTRADRTGEGTLDFDFGVGVDPLAKAAFDLRTASGVFVGDDGGDD